MNKLYIFMGTIMVAVTLVIGILVAQNLSGNNISSGELDGGEIELEELADSIEEIEETPINEDKTKTTIEDFTLHSTIYQNAEWGIEIDIPKKWADWGYYIKTRTESDFFGGKKYENETLLIVADFEDWEGFELLRILKETPSYRENLRIAELAGSRYQGILQELNKRLEQGDDIGDNFWDLADQIYFERYGYKINEDHKGFGAPIMIWPEENIFYQDEDFIYIIVHYNHDAPSEFFNNNWDDFLMKDLKTMVRKI